MAYVLEVETRFGVFEEMRDASLVAVLSEMSDRLRKGEGAGVLRIRNARTSELLFRDRLGRPSDLPQHVQVKSAVESQFETVRNRSRDGSDGSVFASRRFDSPRSRPIPSAVKSQPETVGGAR